MRSLHVGNRANVAYGCCKILRQYGHHVTLIVYDERHLISQPEWDDLPLRSEDFLDEFDFTAQPSLNRALVVELSRCEFIDRRESVILLGGPGTGKTHVAIGLAAAACQRGKRVRFFRVTELLTQLLEAREERVLGRLRGQLARLDLLVLDEFGYVPASQVGAELLFDVISTSYERTSVIVTTNLPFEEWKEVLGSERLTGATLDRLTHRCTIIETGRESYRLREARRRRRGAASGSRPPAVDEGQVEG